MPEASVRAIGYSVRLPVTTPAAFARSLAREAREADSCTKRNVPVTPMTPVKTPKMMARSRGFEPSVNGLNPRPRCADDAAEEADPGNDCRREAAERLDGHAGGSAG
jgi:hypothetical protein